MYVANLSPHTPVAPCVTITQIRPVEAHSFLSFSPCVELCLSGQPGGRRAQRLLHLSLLLVNKPPQNNKPLCAHHDFGPVFLVPLLARYFCIFATLLCCVFPSIVPTASATNVTVHKLLLYQRRPTFALPLLSLRPLQKSFFF